MSRNIQGENVRLKTINLHLENKVDQLTNNWNELEEWVKEKVNEDWDFSTGEKNAYDAYDNVLDKMKEIKERNNGQMP